jgi:hypothetical protein
MPYHVVSLTLAHVRQGALGFQRQLSVSLREVSALKVYSASPFDLEARRRIKERFGGDVVYFFNDAAWQECRRLGIELEVVAEISEEELPRRRAVVIGRPE